MSSIEYLGLEGYCYLVFYFIVLALLSISKAIYPNIIKTTFNALQTQNAGLIFYQGIRIATSWFFFFLAGLLIFTKISISIISYSNVSNVSHQETFIFLLILLFGKSIFSLVFSSIMFGKPVNIQLFLKPIYSLPLKALTLLFLDVLGFYQHYISLEVLIIILIILLFISFIYSLIQNYNHLNKKTNESQLYVFLYLCSSDMSYFTIILFILGRYIS